MVTKNAVFMRSVAFRKRLYRKFIERKALTYLWGKIDKTKNLPIVTYVMSFLNK